MTEQHGFRFGVVAARAGSGDEWLAVARRIESMGYSTLLMPDGLRHVWSPLPALAAAAAATRDLHVGTYVLVNDFRNPVLVAKEAATLDALSGGRFELGLGAGRPQAADDDRMLGLRFDSGAVRVARLAEAIGIVKAVLSGQPASAPGPHYAVSDAAISPPPTRRPRLLVAGWGPRLLALAGREADIVALGMPPATTEDALRERLRRLREAAADRAPGLELNVNLMAVGEQVPAWIAQRMGLTAADLATSATALLGSTDVMCETLRRRREAFGISYLAVSLELMESLAPVVERLAGA